MKVRTEVEFQEKFPRLRERMRWAGMPELAIAMLELYYRRLLAGEDGRIPECEIEPVAELPDAEDLGKDYAAAGHRVMSQTVVIKLNGGLGTGMGLEKAKSLLVVKEDFTFLDLIARQAEATGVPLLLMNSPATRSDSLARLERYPGLRKAGLPLDFVQHRIPKLDPETLLPVSWPENPALEWCPPGHGDLYPAFASSGILTGLLEKGFRYAFVSNADNLGAGLDPAILGYFVEKKAPFMMEVADRTAADRKGGHLARRRSDGRLMLREAAQCPEGELEAFQDYQRYRYFNTNSLWLDLKALETRLKDREQPFELPLIVNRKPVDPRRSETPEVLQLETAMGAAIGVFPGALAIRVPRSRFAPVKTTDDLLAVRSDAYRLEDDFTVRLAAEAVPVIRLDPEFYRLVDNFEAHFPAGPPSLVACRELTVEGDLIFGRDIAFKGCVRLVNRKPEAVKLADGLEISGG